MKTFAIEASQVVVTDADAAGKLTRWCLTPAQHAKLMADAAYAADYTKASPALRDSVDTLVLADAIATAAESL
jgi:hypothetical protein